MTEHLTPGQIEARYDGLMTELAAAEVALADARNREVACKHLMESATRKATLSKDCPVVGRHEGQVTVAYRDAWVADQAETLQQAYDLAKVTRQAAKDHVETLGEQAMITMALGKSVGLSLNMTSSSSGWRR